MPQREDDISASIRRMKEALEIPDDGLLHSGGQIHAFRRGWAKDIWGSGMVTHYWRRSPFNLAYVESRCGLFSATANMYGEGNLRRCKNCEKAMRKGKA